MLSHRLKERVKKTSSQMKHDEEKRKCLQVTVWCFFFFFIFFFSCNTQSARSERATEDRQLCNTRTPQTAIIYWDQFQINMVGCHLASSGHKNLVTALTHELNLRYCFPVCFLGYIWPHYVMYSSGGKLKNDHFLWVYYSCKEKKRK